MTLVPGSKVVNMNRERAGLLLAVYDNLLWIKLDDGTVVTAGPGYTGWTEAPKIQGTTALYLDACHHTIHPQPRFPSDRFVGAIDSYGDGSLVITAAPGVKVTVV